MERAARFPTGARLLRDEPLNRVRAFADYGLPLNASQRKECQEHSLIQNCRYSRGCMHKQYAERTLALPRETCSISQAMDAHPPVLWTAAAGAAILTEIASSFGRMLVCAAIHSDYARSL